MVDIKKMSLTDLGHLLLVGIVFLVIVYLIMAIVGPFFVALGLTGITLTVTDTLLLLLVIKLYTS
tara:strand:+ start:776 stop:970 length:195 start_codon:yes stop_codon:yes gene_type:complete